MSPEDTYYYSFLSLFNVEEFVDIRGYEESYAISNLGNVLSKDRIVACGRKNGRRHIKARILKTKLNRKSKVPSISIQVGGRKKFPTIVFLVCDTFLGPMPKNKWKYHKNKNPQDNRLFNLFLGEPEECQHSKGDDHFRSKLSEKDVLNIIELLPTVPTEIIAKRFNIEPASVRSIAHGNTWGWLTGITRQDIPVRAPVRYVKPMKGIKLNKESVLQIVSLLSSTSQSEIAKMFEVSRTHIRSISNGKTWSHITKINPK